VRDQVRERALRRIARLAARALALPMAAVDVGHDGRHREGGRILVSFGFAGAPDGVEAFAARAAASSGVVVVPDAAAEPRGSADAHVGLPPSVRFGAGVPVSTPDGITVGSLCVFGHERRPDLTDDEVETLRDLAALVGDEIAHDGHRRDLLVAQDEARRLATTDPLTGLSNRRMLDGLLDHAIALARRTGYALAVLMIGLDAGAGRLGSDGDHEGEGEVLGDDVLVEMAERLERAVREHDLVARVGAGEFVVVLQAIDRAAVAEAAGRLHEALVAVAASGAGGTVGAGVRVSVGVALHPADGEDLASLLRAADVAMDEARSGGGGVRRYLHG
jgi:diguanylate cyclase (GGDEF)-like protein